MHQYWIFSIKLIVDSYYYSNVFIQCLFAKMDLNQFEFKATIAKLCIFGAVVWLSSVPLRGNTASKSNLGSTNTQIKHSHVVFKQEK